jgi:transcriptional regulator with XRE-family HTH domain
MPASSAFLAERLHWWIEERGMNVHRLARISGVQASFIYDILHGKSLHPSAIRLTQVAHSLGISIADLLEPPSVHGVTGHSSRPEAWAHSVQVEQEMLPVMLMQTEGEAAGQPSSTPALVVPRAWMASRGLSSHATLSAYRLSAQLPLPGLAVGDLLLVLSGKDYHPDHSLYLLHAAGQWLVRRLDPVIARPGYLRVGPCQQDGVCEELPAEGLPIMGCVVGMLRGTA